MRNRAAKLGVVTFLTLVRFPLVMLFFTGAIIYAAHPAAWLFVTSVICLILSATTDLFDGMLARKFGVQTEFGAQADPLMDKFFYLATFPLLIFVATDNGHYTHAIILLIMTVLFLSRDQWVTFLRSIGAIYNISGGAHLAGKIRTCLSFPMIAAIYLYEESPVPIIPAAVIYATEAIALVVNAVSVYTYTRFYWPCLIKSASLHPDQVSRIDAEATAEE